MLVKLKLNTFVAQIENRVHDSEMWLCLSLSRCRIGSFRVFGMQAVPVPVMDGELSAPASLILTT